MILTLGYTLILGKPLIFWLGLATFIFVLLTAILGYMVFKGKKASFKWHTRLAWISLILAGLHGLFGIMVYI